MTNDYKEILLKYITNNLSKEQGTNIPEFSDIISESATSLYYELNDAFEYGFRQNGVVQCKNVDGEYNGFIIVYGMYYTDEDKHDSLAKGYMLLFDNNFNLVQLIKQYNSGTDCGIFMKVIVVDDGTLVALDHYDNRNRILILNNPSIKLPSQQNYILKLRTSYNLQENVENMSYTLVSSSYVLDKDPNSANYLIGATDVITGYEALTKLKINVGGTNTWTNYTFSWNDYYVNDNYLYATNTYVYWQNEVPYITSFVYHNGSYYNGNVWECILWKVGNNGTTTISQGSYGTEIASIYLSYMMGNAFNGGYVEMISDSNFYFVESYGLVGYQNIGEDNTLCITSVRHYNNGTINSVYSENFIQESYTGASGAYSDIEMFNLNGTICMIFSEITERLASFTPMITKALLITSNDDYAIKSLGAPYYSTYSEFHVSTIINQFDLYKFYILYDDFDSGWSLNRSDIIYNYLHYNGPAYENVNSLKANQGILYDVNGNIFVRGVYNHVVSDNMTEDTIQIPNTMVNDIQITQNKLMSQTNQPMIVNDDTIEKNIYETLYINYFNTINMENQNNTFAIPNKVGAIRVNEAISSELDYDDMTITKYRINYEDETTLVKEVNNVIINNVATFTIPIYVDKNVVSIDLISEDEETVYQTINYDFEVGKYYVFTQDCYIE